LKEAGLVAFRDLGPRGRLLFSPTSTAKQEVEARWPEYLDQVDLDLDTAVRLAWALAQENPQAASRYARNAQQWRTDQLQSARRSGSNRLHLGVVNIEDYKLLRERSRLRRLQGEEIVL